MIFLMGVVGAKVSPSTASPLSKMLYVKVEQQVKAGHCQVDEIDTSLHNF